MLEVSHISKTFNAGTVNEKRALSDLSLRLADGEFATIVGSNGAGKSTLFNAIAGVFYVDAGTITLDGRDITFLPSYKRSRRIGHLFQDPLKGTAPHMTIEENLAVAYLRSSDRHVLFGRVSRRDRDFFRDALAQLDMGLEDPEELRLLKYTPSSALGSCRYKIADPEKDDTDYRRILEVFKKHNVRYFFYNGGNDSMDTCNKINTYMQSVGYECRVMGVPKTIDNDLFGTDHCPGYASAAKYIATSMMEVYHDAHVYDTGMIVVMEIMGRHAGWLAASAALASEYGAGPDLIYLPETDFSMPKFIEDVKRVYAEKGSCIIAVSEGIHYEDGGFVSEAKVAANDGFGHAQLGGLAAILAQVLKEETGAKVRGIELNLLQRCGAHLASETDIEESFMAGKAAVENAVNGINGRMIGFERGVRDGRYACKTKLIPLMEVANVEKKIPREWINAEGNGVNHQFIEYALPLIQGEPDLPKVDSLPRFAKLKKVLVK